ncbi:unnamed protein product [Durusdinium trenchii]|uniref:Uncharacterized protein n=1 Tax=Durusdinium trenchii TaxID=1381693 RepID=A0ABP0J6G1_9DINO
MEGAINNEDGLQVLETLARQLLATKLQHQVACDFARRLRSAGLCTASLADKENAVPARPVHAQEEEELCKFLSKLKAELKAEHHRFPLPKNPSPSKSVCDTPETAKLAYPESLVSTPYLEWKSPGSQDRFQRLKQLEVRGSQGHAARTDLGGLVSTVRTEDVPLRALWKEFQAFETLEPAPVPAVPTVPPASTPAPKPRLPCMVNLEKQEKHLEQMNILLNRMEDLQPCPGTPPLLQNLQMPSLGTPPLKEQPCQAHTCPASSKEDLGTPSSCLRL